MEPKVSKILDHHRHLVVKNSRDVNWLGLPNHLIALIAEKFIDVRDVIRFGAVCQSWQVVYTENRKFRHCLPRQLPLFMHCTEVNNNGYQTWCYYSLSKKKDHEFHSHVRDWFCQGSSHGWLVMMCENFNLSLKNPFLADNNEIQLPRLADSCKLNEKGIRHTDYKIKAVLSVNPMLNPNYAIMAIHGVSKALAFYKPGDKSWTFLDSEYKNILDLIYYRNQFYFVDRSGAVFSCDINHGHPKVSLVAPPPVCKLPPASKYIVESSGDLLQITRNCGLGDGLSTMFNCVFKVFKLDKVHGEWIEVNSLDGRVVFVGDNSSMSLSAVDFPECKPDCIYFTDDWREEFYIPCMRTQAGLPPRDMGVFNLKDGTIKPHYPKESKFLLPAPIWIEPSL